MTMLEKYLAPSPVVLNQLGCLAIAGQILLTVYKDNDDTVGKEILLRAANHVRRQMGREIVAGRQSCT